MADVAVSLDNNWGALFIFGIITSALWGAGSVQVYLYYDSFWKTDTRWLKTLVFVTWALDTVHQALYVKTLYSVLVSHFGDLGFLLYNSKDTVICNLFTAIICVLVQGFYIIRIWILSKRNYIFTVTCSVLSIAQLTMTIIYFGKSIGIEFAVEIETIVAIARAVTSISAVTDSVIAASMVFLLMRSRTGFAQTDSLVQRIVIYTMGTGLTTGICEITSFILAFASPTTFFYIAFFLALPKLYLNSMMTSLNSRKGARSRSRSNTSELSSSSLRGAQTFPVNVQFMSIGESGTVSNVKANSNADDIELGNVPQAIEKSYRHNLPKVHSLDVTRPYAAR
ncbi:hypothetical protein PNOK_0415700 [Pyrrhoderma noxium]|uniref:DUF6534 domain-containing protein n=1 Tax=Pyrrhoderma noxium TaxID=2282107 RepID=A0A286UIC6_9AGAM|nr:hypothetical protein PNOK_0415700 [Pyrrhoderma noxium]